MAHLRYYNYPGVGEQNNKDFSYSQAVRVGDRIECAGQGGWDPNAGLTSIPNDVDAQIDQAFANVDLALRTAGGQGWKQVFSVKSYHVPLDDAALGAMVRNFRRWMPDHQPIWTTIGISRLGAEGMRVEIDVVAHDPEGASKADEDGDRGKTNTK